MSRGVIYTATFTDFLKGFHAVEVPQGYNRVQINQFTAGSVDRWITVRSDQQDVDRTGGSMYIVQEAPLGKSVASFANRSKLLKVFCEGIDAQSNVVAAVSVGETAYLGMNGNPYKVTNRVLRFYITNEFDALVFNTGIVLQYTFI